MRGPPAPKPKGHLSRYAVSRHVDVRELSTESRLLLADQIRTLSDFDLPELTGFNSPPCDRPPPLDEGLRHLPSPCRRCGIRFRKHQRVGIAWLYMRGSGLIAD